MTRGYRTGFVPGSRALAAAAVVALLALVAAGRASARYGDTEPFLPQQWGLTQIGAMDAWSVSRGAGVRVGVVDTGVDLGHEEMAGNKIAGSVRCIGTGGAANRCGGSAQDDNGHGTHVAGTIAAAVNGKGIAGVAPESTLLIVKALDKDGAGDAVDVAAAIDWLAAREAKVINLSLADASAVGQVIGSPIEASIRRAFAQYGTVFVLAGGNKSETGTTPTSATGGYGDLPALVVAATGPEGAPARYNIPLGTAKWGLAAPGGDGATTRPERDIVSSYWYAQQANGYAWSEGTSMAAPHVSGVAALLAAQGVRGQAAMDRIISTLQPLDCGQGCRGRLDARAALGAAASPASQPPVPSRPPVAKPAKPSTLPSDAPASTNPGALSTGPVSPPAPAVVPASNDPTVAAPGRLSQDAPVIGADLRRRSRPVVQEAVAGILLVIVAAATAVATRNQRKRRRTVTTLP